MLPPYYNSMPIGLHREVVYLGSTFPILSLSSVNGSDAPGLPCSQDQTMPSHVMVGPHNDRGSDL